MTDKRRKNKSDNRKLPAPWTVPGANFGAFFGNFSRFVGAFFDVWMRFLPHLCAPKSFTIGQERPQNGSLNLLKNTDGPLVTGFGGRLGRLLFRCLLSAFFLSLQHFLSHHMLGSLGAYFRFVCAFYACNKGSVVHRFFASWRTFVRIFGDLRASWAPVLTSFLADFSRFLFLRCFTFGPKRP